MPIEVSWYDEEKTIRYWQFIEDWSGQEYLSIAEKLTKEDTQIPHPFVGIYDFTKSKTRAQDVLHIFRSGEHLKPYNVDLILVVGATFALTLANAYNRIKRRHNYSIIGVSSMEKALAEISKQRTTF